MQAKMGRNNPYIVLEDDLLDEVVENIVISSFLDNGQRCTGTSRLIVMRPIVKTLIEKLVTRLEKLVIADGFTEGVDNGPVIDESQLNTYKHYVKSALDE